MTPKLSRIFLATLLILCASSALARNTRHLLPIDEAIERGRSEGILDETMQFHFGKGNRGRGGQSLGSGVANRKTNAVNKSDVEACNWVFLSALKTLQEDARRAGATSVVEIVSYYKKKEHSSATEFECYAGALMAGVALKGSYVK